ncbi:ras-2 protein [Halenospora varia]|nr:ras-2 protein [Halenospora varia]
MAAHELVFLGDCGVGKKRFIQHLVGPGFDERQNPQKKEATIDFKPCTIHMHERAGLEEETGALCRNAEGILLVYSTALISSFQQIPTIHEQIQKFQAASHSLSSDPATLPAAPPPVQIVLVGIEDKEKREVSHEDGLELAKNLGCGFFEAAVETKANVNEVLSHMIRLCREARRVQGGDLETSKSGWMSCFGWRKS